jgi:hypothetical protein
MQREKIEQSHIAQLLRTVGAKVYVVGTRRRREDFQGTMQTPGLADLVAFLPPGRSVNSGGDLRAELLFIECKAAGGRLRPEQREFREHCLDAEVAHVVGDLNAVIAWLLARGRLRGDNVPHYRRPSEGASV